jgi:succinate dehydrogenase flavin-adding protein (antitoxin of CptAB toxin-antitoxin module)
MATTRAICTPTKETEMAPVSHKTVGHIFETMDYDQFRFIPGNRKLDQSHLDNMVEARKAGERINHLVTAITHANRYWIADGQHYFESSRLVGQRFQYRIIDVPIEHAIDVVLKMNCRQKSWKSIDYRDLWIAREYENYIKLKVYQESRKLNNVDLTIILLGKDQSSRSMKIFREGGYKMGDEKLADKRIDLIHDFSKLLAFAWDRDFVRAVCQLSVMTNYKHDRMLTRLRRTAMKKQGGTEQYMEAIRSIYNTGTVSDADRI